jgi:hypothetical protein
MIHVLPTDADTARWAPDRSRPPNEPEGANREIDCCRQADGEVGRVASP